MGYRLSRFSRPLASAMRISRSSNRPGFKSAEENIPDPVVDFFEADVFAGAERRREMRRAHWPFQRMPPLALTQRLSKRRSDRDNQVEGRDSASCEVTCHG